MPGHSLDFDGIGGRWLSSCLGALCLFWGLIYVQGRKKVKYNYILFYNTNLIKNKSKCLEDDGTDFLHVRSNNRTRLRKIIIVSNGGCRV